MVGLQGTKHPFFLNGNGVSPDNISRVQILRVYLKFAQMNAKWFCDRDEERHCLEAFHIVNFCAASK